MPVTREDDNATPTQPFYCPLCEAGGSRNVPMAARFFPLAHAELGAPYGGGGGSVPFDGNVYPIALVCLEGHNYEGTLKHVPR